MLKSKNLVTLFINSSYNSFYDLQNIYSKWKVMCQNMGFFMGVVYEHPFNRYPCKWSSYFYTLPIVNN